MVARTEVGHVLPSRPTPFVDNDNRAFWGSGESGVLSLNRCNSCSNWIHPAAPVCRKCRSTDVAPQPTGGRGRVATYTVNHQPWIPGSEPYIIAWVELHEQKNLYLTTNLVEIDGDDVEIGLEVEVVFEKHPTKDIWYPLFRPTGVPA